MKRKNVVPLDTAATPKGIRTLGEDDDQKKPAEPPAPPAPPPISFFSLFRYAKGLDKFLMLIGVLCSIGTGVLQPINTLTFGTMTGDIIKHSALMEIFKNDTVIYERESKLMIEAVTTYAVSNAAIGGGMLVLTYLSIVLFNYAALRQIFDIRKRFFRSIMNQDVSWYDMNQTGDFSSRMSEDLIKLEDGMGEKVSMFVHFQSAFVSSLILALVKGWELALICLTSLPATMIAVGIVSVITSRLARREVEAYGVAGAIAEEVFSAIRTVVAFGGQGRESRRYNDKLVLARDINIKRSFFGGLGFGILWFCIYASYALAFWYGVGLVIDGRGQPDPPYDAGTMVTVFFSVMMGSMNFGISSPYIETFGVAKGAGAKIFQVIDNKPVINASKNNGERKDKLRGRIVFEDVSFHYPSRPDVPILDGFNLTIEPGEKVALVGSSGCGKSTCVQLLQRFYDPIGGIVRIDDAAINGYDLAWMRSNIGVVGQEPVLFGTTVAENIRYGQPEATRDQIEAAARKANAHDFIMRLPQGYDTLVGERGAQLSGGQKQRIAIARALVRDPAILLLDEATSALDTNSEAKVQAALDEASRERTTVIVAHRLTTIRNADKIAVISAGRVVELGTHDELMALSGHYRKLADAQVSVSEAFVGREEVAPEGDVADAAPASAGSNRSSVASVKEEVTSARYEREQPVSMMRILKENAPEWPYVALGCVTSLVMGATMPVFAILFGDIIGILGNEDVAYVRQQTDLYCVYFVIAGTITGLATFLQIWNFGIAGEHLTMRLRGRTFETMLRQEVAWFDDRDNGVGSLCTRLSTDAANVQGATGQRVGTILQSISTICLAVGLSMFYEYRLGLVTLAFTPLILVATFAQGRIIKQSTEHQTKMIERATKLAVEAVGNVRTVASLGCEHIFADLYEAELRPGLATSKKNVHYRGAVFGLARSLMFFAYASCIYYGGTLIRDEGLSYEKIFKVAQALIMGTVSIANALAFAPNFQKGIESATKIFRLLDREPVVADQPTATDVQWKSGDVRFSDVFFSYPTRKGVRVLRGLNLDVMRGKTVALVGPSGCGKSTIVQLLERFYDPDAGSVSVDDDDIRNRTLASLRSQLGIVSQEPTLFDRTIGENIAYGDNSRQVRPDEIIDAAKKANIHNFIASLPTGYDTRLGDKGTQLSGGQKQRIAIARALVRDPAVLLLDEATSALDTESERVVQEALDKAKEGRTCVTIAHRLTTIQDADVICVIERGRVAELGKHSQLIAKKGLYYHLHKLQGA